MNNVEMLFRGFAVALTMQNILAAIAGSLLGLLVGAMPGIGSLAGVALLLPLTFKFEPSTAIIMLGSLYYANMFGGAFSSILINIPGDGPAIMTTLDGYPMAQKGRPGQALFTSITSSFIGGLIGMCILTFSASALAEIGLRFGPAEMAALLMVAMTSISWLVGENPIKGVIVTCLGTLLATIGMDSVTGTPRFNFGNLYLLGGIPFISVVIGLVGLSQVIELMVGRDNPPQVNEQRLTLRGSFLTKDEFFRLLPPALRSGFFGTFVGILPGAGATAASFMAYAVQKKAFKNKVPLGEGAVEGIACVEAANNAAAAGAFAPLLALGIPGSGTGAVLLGGLMMWGLNPGPMLFTTNPDFAWGLIAALFIANCITLAISFSVIPWMIKVVRVPVRILIPSIVVICIVGSYSTSSSMFGVFVMIMAGIVGYILKRYKYPTAPFVLSMVLTKMLEVNLRRSFLISRGSPWVFFQKPISAILMLLLIAIILTPLVKSILRHAREKKLAKPA